MRSQTTIIIRVIFILLLGVLALGLSLSFVDIAPVAAQEPIQEEDVSAQFEQEDSADTVYSLFSSKLASFDLSILKKSSHITVTTGSPITFTITITNNGPDTVTLPQFIDNVPSQMKNVAYAFNTTVISNGKIHPCGPFLPP